MFSYAIIHNGASIGTLTAEREGLYWRVAARCRDQGNRILRLYARNGEQVHLLGVPMPEGEGLELAAKVAASAFDFTPQTTVSTRKTDDWTSFSGVVLGVPVSEALRRRNTVAIPHRAGEAFPLMAHFRRFRLGQISEQVYWMTDLEENPPGQEKTVDNGAKYDRISGNSIRLCNDEVRYDRRVHSERGIGVSPSARPLSAASERLCDEQSGSFPIPNG